MSEVSVKQWMTERRRMGDGIYLVLDSQREREARQALLQGSRFEQFQSVYGGTSVADLADAGPFVFSIEPADDRRFEGLLTRPDNHWGWLASMAQGQLPLLVSHWQERLIVGERLHQALYRFHDNRVLARALNRLSEQDLPAYLGPAKSVCYWEGAQWRTRENPSPGTYTVPAQSSWLQTEASPEQAIETRLINAHRYLLAEHEDTYTRLADQRSPQAWLRQVVVQAHDWGWHSPEQFHFLLIHSLEAHDYTLAPYWQVQAGETPAQHFDRVHQAVKLLHSETPK